MTGSSRRVFWLIPLAALGVKLFVLGWQHRDYQRLARERDLLAAALFGSPAPSQRRAARPQRG